MSTATEERAARRPRAAENGLQPPRTAAERRPRQAIRNGHLALQKGQEPDAREFQEQSDSATAPARQPGIADIAAALIRRKDYRILLRRLAQGENPQEVREELEALIPSRTRDRLGQLGEELDLRWSEAAAAETDLLARAHRIGLAVIRAKEFVRRCGRLKITWALFLRGWVPSVPSNTGERLGYSQRTLDRYQKVATQIEMYGRARYRDIRHALDHYKEEHPSVTKSGRPRKRPLEGENVQRRSSQARKAARDSALAEAPPTEHKTPREEGRSLDWWTEPTMHAVKAHLRRHPDEAPTIEESGLSFGTVQVLKALANAIALAEHHRSKKGFSADEIEWIQTYARIVVRKALEGRGRTGADALDRGEHPDEVPIRLRAAE